MSLIVVSYFALWQPVRNGWGNRVVYPVLSEIAEAYPGATVKTSGRGVRVTRKSVEGPLNSIVTRPPAGVKFLLPALFVVGIAPDRPWWLGFFAGHILLAVLVALSLAGFIVGLTFFGYFGHGVQLYALDAYSLGFPIFAYVKRIGL
ncbi:hypothetical protein [Longibacter salinarum]|nr:hypothetical protein [Longibacter salinarum]